MNAESVEYTLAVPNSVQMKIASWVAVDLAANLASTVGAHPSQLVQMIPALGIGWITREEESATSGQGPFATVLALIMIVPLAISAGDEWYLLPVTESVP